jgi:O-antigen/teichoic acid export membrane protein
MMFFQNGPADTFDFMLLGFGVIFVLMGGYLGSLIVRFRRMKRDEQVLQDVMEQD